MFTRISYVLAAGALLSTLIHGAEPTRVALIPSDADATSIRFEKAKAISIPALGNVFEVTYSYTGQPLASDEFGGRDFRFKVYFRADDLPAVIRQALAAGKAKRADVATFFTVSAKSELMTRMVVDETHSSLCAKSLRDGVWMHSEPDCQERIVYRPEATPSSYLAVAVDAAPAARNTR